MFQFSIYLCHCSSRENADIHVKRVKTFLPEKGEIGILYITDKQFGAMILLHGKKRRRFPRLINNWSFSEINLIVVGVKSP